MWFSLKADYLILTITSLSKRLFSFSLTEYFAWGFLELKCVNYKK